MKNPKIETDILTENELKECDNKKNCSGRCLGTIVRHQRIKKSIYSYQSISGDRLNF